MRQLFIGVVTPTGFEPMFSPWKGDVLDRLTKGPHNVECGDPPEIRTRDTLIKSQVLCQLS